MVVYGPADNHSVDFLGETQAKVVAVAAAHLPIVVGGDFNLIRSRANKNNDDIYWPRVWRFLTMRSRPWRLGKWPDRGYGN